MPRVNTERIVAGAIAWRLLPSVMDKKVSVGLLAQLSFVVSLVPLIQGNDARNIILVKFHKISNDLVIYVVTVRLRRNYFHYFYTFVSYADIHMIIILFTYLLFVHSCLPYMEGNRKVLIENRLDLWQTLAGLHNHPENNNSEKNQLLYFCQNDSNGMQILTRNTSSHFREWYFNKITSFTGIEKKSRLQHPIWSIATWMIMKTFFDNDDTFGFTRCLVNLQ